ncbi:cysteine protease ATG4D [Musca domestica]|uniref:Cysteine protease n=1 Tax=Musca domestica TaxID=7370 RepID=A0A9J7I3Y3_MUSDO|nr:cysteine protease ATG4D [Musca domestica]XP_005185865.2 cysteine protease ATG4D [Musca domestica]
MNYDGLLSQLTTDDKLNLFQVALTPEDGAIEEEQAATIQCVNPRSVASSSHNAPSTTITTTSTQNVKTDQTATPTRKISTSSRFINAFQQLYTTSAASSCVASAADNDEAESSNNAAGRTPTKGMESKLLSMWHNVKYGWSGKLKSNFSKEQPVWLLGRCYHRKCTPPSSMENSSELGGMTAMGPDQANMTISNAYDTIQQDTGGIGLTPNNSSSALYPILNPQQVEEIVVPQELALDATDNQVGDNPWEEGIEGFKRDFYSRVWMTYRREFPIMNGSNYTSDCGWGCMLRSGQMLLAQALLCHFLGRSWRYDPESQLHSTLEDNMHKKIIKWFGDSSSKSSPFSIHTLVKLGEEMGKKPGDWYGPASVSYLLRQALKNAAQENADFDNLVVYVAKDCTIYMGDIEAECCIPEPTPKSHVPWKKQQTPKSNEIKSNWKSLIVLVPLRLGTDKLNPVYAHCLKLLLSTEYCIGIIGGRPKHSLYFVGFQEDKLIHLDPHYCQEMVDVNQENFPLHSFHCKSPRKLKSSKMDPSCCIGFYCQTKTDFDNFVESVQLYLHPMRCASGSLEKQLPQQQQQQQQMPSSLTNSFTETSNQYAEMNYPLFSFSRGRCLQHETNLNEMSDSLYKPLQKQLQQFNQDNGQHSMPIDDDSETEEFVLL